MVTTRTITATSPIKQSGSTRRYRAAEWSRRAVALIRA